MCAQSKSSFEYLEHLPKNGAAPSALVFLLHGYGKDAHLMEKTAIEVAKRMPEAAIIMPHAPEILEIPKSSKGHMLQVPDDVRADEALSQSGSFDQSARRQWFSIAFDDPEAMRNKILTVAARFNDFMDMQCARFGLPAEDAALMGFSQGGGVSLYAAYMRDKPPGCVVGHSTLFIEGDELVSKPPTLFLYGTADHEFTKTVDGTQAVYAQTMQHLSDYLGPEQLTVRAVDGLTHRTSSASRAIVADYLAGKLAF